MEEVEELVRQKTINAGADLSTATLIDIKEVPVAYVPSNDTAKSSGCYGYS